ncbi:MAG: HDIG domain-containing metalloprotein [Dehalococcoidia bacterium]
MTSQVEPTRDTAWELLCEFTQSESLRKHALTVEGVMRYFARRAGQDDEPWGIAGMLHDYDYEQYPTAEEHGRRGAEVMRERGWPEVLARAVESHNPATGVTRDSAMERTLYAVDELAGFITAVALVRPSKSIHDVKVKSVRKKMKDKAFARAVNRDDIVNGADELGVELNEHIGEVIAAMQEIAAEIGLEGERAGG